MVNCEAWTKRELEPVNRNGVIKLGRRRLKGQKSEKKDKSEKSGKDSKNAEYNVIRNGNIDHNNYPMGEGFLDEDIASDFNDIYEGFFQGFFSFGSMSMDHAQTFSTSNKMMTLEHIPPTSSSSEMISLTPKTNSDYNERAQTSSQDDVRISFTPYSLVFSFLDSVIPTRREDYNELATATKSNFKDFMLRSYESITISDLNDFQVEFVTTGVSESDEIFIVFQSTALFDSNSHVFPEASQVQNTLGDALAQNEELWMQYITALQELNPDNAFSSTVNIAYINGIPKEKRNIQSTASSRADIVAYSAAAGITMLSLLAFVVKRSRDRQELEDHCSLAKERGSRFNESCESTVAETLSCMSSTSGTEQRLYFDATDEETRRSTIGHSTGDRRSMYKCSSSDLDSASEDDSINEEASERSRDIDDSKMYGFNAETMNSREEDCNHTIRNAAVFQSHRTYNEKSYSSNKRWNPLREIWKRSNPLENHEYLEENQTQHDSGGEVQEDQAAWIEEGKMMKKQHILEGKLLHHEALQLDEDKHKSQEKLRSELAIIKAEEAARTAEEQRLKKERKLVIDRDS